MNTIPLQAGHDAMPTQKAHQWSWAASQSLAILAVDNLIVDDEGLRLLQAVDQGRMTHDEAIAVVLQQAVAISHQHQ